MMQISNAYFQDDPKNWHTWPWSPKIDIQSLAVSGVKKQDRRVDDRLEVTKDSESVVSNWTASQEGEDGPFEYELVQSSLARKTFLLTATVKCSMSFVMFPFDSHVCNLTVSSTFNF